MSVRNDQWYTPERFQLFYHLWFSKSSWWGSYWEKEKRKNKVMSFMDILALQLISCGTFRGGQVPSTLWNPHRPTLQLPSFQRPGFTDFSANLCRDSYLPKNSRHVGCMTGISRDGLEPDWATSPLHLCTSRSLAAMPMNNCCSHMSLTAQLHRSSKLTA